MNRGYTTGLYGLELDHVSAGWVQSVEGGNRVGEVVVEKVGSDPIQKKHIAGLKYEDLSISCGTGMSRGFYEWIKKSFGGNFHRVNGAVHVCDFDLRIKKTMEFHQALISEFGMPALDASAKDAAKLSLKVTPEWTRTQAGQGSVSGSQFPTGRGQQKLWSPANFRLRIDGLERACARVSKVEALVLKQKIADNPLGEMRETHREPVSVEVPNLTITLPEANADEFWKWEHEFLIEGKASEDDEKTGTLEYLAPDLKKVLFTINMAHIGIFKMTPDKMEAHGEAIRRVKVEMYVEEMDFDYGDDATWT